MSVATPSSLPRCRWLPSLTSFLHNLDHHVRNELDLLVIDEDDAIVGSVHFLKPCQKFHECSNLSLGLDDLWKRLKEALRKDSKFFEVIHAHIQITNTNSPCNRPSTWACGRIRQWWRGYDGERGRLDSSSSTAWCTARTGHRACTQQCGQPNGREKIVSHFGKFSHGQLIYLINQATSSCVQVQAHDRELSIQLLKLCFRNHFSQFLIVLSPANSEKRKLWKFRKKNVLSVLREFLDFFTSHSLNSILPAFPRPLASFSTHFYLL